MDINHIRTHTEEGLPLGEEGGVIFSLIVGSTFTLSSSGISIDSFAALFRVDLKKCLIR